MIRQLLICGVLLLGKSNGFAAYKKDNDDKPAVSVIDEVEKKTFETAVNKQFPALANINVENFSFRETYNKPWYRKNVRFDKAFNPLFLPFSYKCKAGKADPNQYLTFPALLSLKFDFINDNICTRHPMFIYQRDKAMRDLRISNVSQSIRAMREWGMNYCIGGELVQDGSLFSGTIVIMNAAGDEVLRKVFKPMDYFSLMGQMVVSWIEYRKTPDYIESSIKSIRAQLGFRLKTRELSDIKERFLQYNLKQDCSDELLKELVRPMTANFDAVTMYGRSFTMEHRSEKEWALYEKILVDAPDFAEIRWWYANQRGWQKSKSKEWEQEMKITAAETHTVIAALRELDGSATVRNIERVKQINKKARVLLPRHWIVAVHDAYKSDYSKVDEEELLKIAEIAYQYPYALWFASPVAHELMQRDLYDLSIPLMLSLVYSDYNPGSGGVPSYERLVYQFTMLGEPRDAMQLVKSSFEHSQSEIPALYAGYLLRSLMAFDEAVDFFEIALEREPESKLAALHLAQTHLDAGNIMAFEAFSKKEAWMLISEPLRQLFLFRAECMQKKEVGGNEIKELRKICKVFRRSSYWSQFSSIAWFELLQRVRKPSHKAHKKNVGYIYDSIPNSVLPYVLAKQVNGPQSQTVYQYAYVMAEIHPDSYFWSTELELCSYRPNDLNVNDLRKLFAKLVKKIDNGKDYNNLSPCELEFISLTIAATGDRALIKKLIEGWKRIAEKTNVTAEQRLHRSRFLILLKKKLKS